ncbi:PAS domain-containing protein [Cyanobacteria bacterium FACHB-DQ100]|nr:PAS domain-containing protein [Cyanobacteria bacterium FACHB-DQ100]
MSSLEGTSLAMGEKSIWECLSDGIAVLDQEWRLTDLNRQQTEWFGVRKEDTVGKIIWDICPEWATLEVQQQFQRSRTEQTPVQLEYFCSKWQRWFELRVCPCDTNTTILTIDITQRKQKEAALREGELRFQAFMNHNPAASWIADQSGRLLYLNPTYFKLFSCPEDAVGKHISEIFPAEIAEQFLQNNQRVFETGAVIETIERAPRLDGSTGDYLVYKFPINHQIEEKLLGGVAVDISEQKRIEATLQEREQHLKIALRTAKLGSWQHDLMTNVLTCSDQCKANFGLPADAEFTHETLFAALHPEDRDRVQTAIQRSIEERTDYEVEERCFYPDGSLHWLIARGGLIYDDNGNPIRLVGVTLDITERKQFEESLKAANQRVSNILESITDAFIAFDQEWRYTYVNQEAARLLGKPPAELLGKRWQEIFPEYVQQGTIFTQQFEKAMTERVTVYCEGFSLAVNRWLEASIFPAASGISVFMRDISDRKQEEQRKALQYAVSKILAEATTLVEMVPTILQALCETLGWQMGVIWSDDPSEFRGAHRADAVLRHVNTWSESTINARSFVEANQRASFAPGIGLPGRIWREQQPVWISDLTQDQDFPRVAEALEAGLRSAFGFPILLGDEFFGVIECFSDRTQEPDEDLLQLMAAIGRQIGQFMERKRTEAALHESQALFHSFMTHSPVAAYIKHESGQYVYVNALIEQLFDRPATELIGNTDFDWFPLGSISQIRANDAAVLERNEAIQFLETVPFGEQERHFMAFKFPIQIASGQRYLGGMSVDITDRIQAETSLRQREEELRVITNTVPVLISFVDAEQRYRFNSQRYEDWFGRSSDEIQGKHLWEVLGEGAYAAIRPYVEQALSGQTTTFESQVSYQDGETRYISANYIPQFDKQQRVTGFVALISDISDRKKYEEALRASAERLSLALTAAKLGDWSWNASTDLVTFSQQACEIFDLQPSANLTWTQLRQRLHEEDQEKARIAVEQAVSEHNDYDIEYRVTLADGTQRWIAAKGRAQYDTSGRVLGMLGVVQDITERKRAEQEREQLLAREQATNQTLQMFIEHTPAAVAMFDRQMHYISASRRWMQEYAPDYTNLEGLSHYEVMPDIPDQWRQVHLRCLAGATERCEEDYYPRHDNSGIWLHWEILPWYVRENEIGGIIIFAENITERKQAEQERERLLAREKIAREQAETANRLKDEFLAVLSHELRSPLNPILGWAKLLKTGNLDATRTVQAITTIERNAKLQSELIEDLLDVSRILQGKLSLSVNPIPLASTIRAAIETVQLAAEAKSITIKANLETEVGHVLGDSTRLQQVVWNLLSNAVKFTPTGGRVEVILAAANNHAEITVRDNGKGIPAHFLPYVFDYFRQEDGASTRKFGGLGLGLAIVRHLVELHGGQVKAESPGEGQGATFTVMLPLMPTSPSTSEETVPMSDTDLQGVQVLVVDDEVDNLELVQFILEEAGATVISVSRATEALERVRQSNPHLIVADIGMPEVDGYTLIQCVRELPPEQGGEIPAIALTAYAGDVNQWQALAAGFQWHLSKPVNPEALVQAIAELVHQT